MKAVIYARFSSEKQNEASIEGQLRECLEYAEYNKIEVIGNYIDRACSARTANRPDFQRMIKDSYKHNFDCVIVWKLDRFARDRYDSAYYKNILKKNGVRVISAKETITEGASGILLESILEGYAEFYSAELAEKVKRGMTDNALKGKANGVKAPFGYYVDKDDRFQINETLAPIVKEVYEMYLDGKKSSEIVKTLNARGIKNNGYSINYNVVYRILTNRKYIGEYKFGDVLIPNAIPALIDEETFNKVQERIAVNKKAPAMHRSEDDYLLTTKLHCGKCGALMTGEIICIIACSNSNLPQNLPESNGSYESVDIDLTKLSSTMIYSEVYNMVYTPENYTGKIVKIYGIYSVYYSKQTGLYYPAVIIPDATACCSQGIEFVLKDKEYPDGYPKEGAKITVIGEFSTYIEYGQTYCHLIDAEIL